MHIFTYQFFSSINIFILQLRSLSMASSSNWTWEQTKVFENSLVTYNNDPDRFQKIAKSMGKTVEDVKAHYQNLVDDVKAIEEGKVSLPNYKGDDAQECSKSDKKKWSKLDVMVIEDIVLK